MFTVEAERNIVISSLAINGGGRGAGEVKVYTRQGGFTGHVESVEGWELVYHNPAVTHNGRGQPTELGDFQRSVFVAGATSQSFFVTSSKNLVYQRGTQEQAECASDGTLTILEGIGTDPTFSALVHTPRIWGGIMR